jgi:hypothetical protein
MGAPVVDTDADPRAVATRRRHRFLRLMFPFLTALLLVAAIGVITVYTERANRRDALALTEEVVRAVEAAVRNDVEAYLTPTATAVRLLAEAAAETGIAGRLPADRRLERQMRGILGTTPELASIFVGDAEGDFLMVQREGGGRRTKLIRAGDGRRVVRWLERDRAGALAAARLDPADRYDPRERPWFDAALSADGVVWSDVYRFFTTGAPGVTASVRAPAPGDVATTVVGADLEIAEIGRFLGDLRIGERGRAVIVTTAGDLVAYPPELAPADFEDVPAVAELDDAILHEAFQRFRVNRAERGVVVIDGVRHLASSAPLADVVGRDWWLLLVVPEESFIGFVAANARTSLALSGVVVLLATVVGVLLTVQGMQSDARAARARRSENAVRAQAQTLQALADLDGLADPGDAASLRRFASIAADAFAAGRASVWRLNAERTALACLESYDRDRGAHTAATTLRADHLGEAWPRLAGPARFTTTVDDGDAALRPLHELYLDGIGTRRLDALPICRGGSPLGALWLEDVDAARAGPSAAGLAALMARLLAPRLEALASAEAGGGIQPPPTGASAPAPVSLSARRQARLVRSLAAAGGVETVAPVLVPSLAVAHVRLGDDAALARTDAAGGACALQHLADTIGLQAERYGIRWWLLRGDVVVAVAEAGSDDTDAARAAHAVADFALALQPACRDVARAAGGRTGFRAGIDVGPAFAAAAARGDGEATIWGEACRLAACMAESAPLSGIQITEAAYAHLARDYLLRRRGSFFVDEVGEIATYILTGRL